MASGKRRPKLSPRNEEDQQYTIINNYYINDCQGVMVGSQNQQFFVFDSGAELLDHPHEALRHGFQKDQVVIAMLNSILNPERKVNPSPLLLQKVEDTFNKMYGNVRSKKRFKEITGMNLVPFLKSKPEKFQLILMNSNWLIKPISLSNPIQISNPVESSHYVVREEKEKPLDVPRQHQYSHQIPNNYSRAVSGDSESDTQEGNSDDEGWTLVTKKRSKEKQAPRYIDKKREKKETPKLEMVSYTDVVMRKPSTKAKKKKEVTNPTVFSGEESIGQHHSLPSTPFQGNDNIDKTTTAFQTIMTDVDSFRKGHFMFLTGRLDRTALTHAVGIFTTIPWIAVFDFDEESRDQGLLSRVEEPLKISRSLHISNWKETVKISEKATTWYFIRGNRAIPDSRFEKGYRHWWKHVNPSISNLAEEIARFVQDTTVLKVLVIWDKDNAQYMNYLVCKLDENIQEHVKFVICSDEAITDESSQAHLRHMQEQIDENITVVNISANNLFLGLMNHIQKCPISQKRYSLCEIPTANDCGNTVDEKGFAWLNEYMDIVYMDQEKSADSDIDTLEEDAHQFFRGGTLKWETRSLCGSEYLDVERDAMEIITEAIKHLVLSFKSGLYTLHHAPGAGGSTLAQRVLWELRDISPCVQIHFHSGASIADMASRLEYLYEKTHLPIIALIDGDDEHNTWQLMRSVHRVCLVILNVKRYPHSMLDKKNTSKAFWLQGLVSTSEARKLAMKFGSFCKEEQRKSSLKDLSKDVKNGIQHHLYEFGLTAYLHEFTGIHSYVEGYLRLDPNYRNKLLPWQNILGYLSLVYYYGQVSIPCQFFGDMLGKPSNYVVTLDDFPFEVKQFVVVDTSSGKANELRICHYIIAKEILEQILTRGKMERNKTSESLSFQASQNLQQFALSFISDASKKKVKTAVSSNDINFILARTFILRDLKDMDGNEVHSKRRPNISKLLVDIPSKSPYTERLEVLVKLTEAFPEEPNFHAHLGRFYAMYRTNEEQSAICALEKALQLCKRKMEGRRKDELDERQRITISQVHHMYGMIYGRQVKYKTRYDKQKDMPKEEFETRVFEILDLADLACEQFIRCREVKTPGHEDSFGFVGEINVRLQVCDFIQRHSNYRNLVDYITAQQQTENGAQVASFIEDSVTAIDDLIVECTMVVDREDIDGSFTDAVAWHHALLGNLGQSLDRLHTTGAVCNKRFKIAAKKLKYSDPGNTANLDNALSAVEIKEIVKCYEDIFEDAFNRGVENKRALDIDFKQWIDAIRYDRFTEEYSIEDVLVQVRRWHSMIATPMSVFYLFVLTSIIGFGSKLENGNTESLTEAQNLKEDLRKCGHWVTRSRYPREWLGNTANGIKQLIPNTAYVGNAEGKVTKVLSNSRKSLVVCKGTIRPPNRNKVGGFIELDLGNNYIPVHVFFVPLRTEFEGSIHAGTRVEFHLGFSFFNGYEAFNVQALKKYECASCGSMLEILSCEQSGICRNASCQQTVVKTENAH